MNDNIPWYQQVWGKVLKGADFVLTDWVDGWSGQNKPAPVYGLGGLPFSEQTPPTNTTPTEAGYGFNIGNNTPTWAAGIGLVLVGLLAYKVFK